MKIKHPSVASNFLKLAATYELDLDLGPELCFPLRLELFKDTERQGWFRVHIWEQESFNIEPTFPVKRNGRRQRYKSSEMLLLERCAQLRGNYNCFKAANESDALAKVVADLKERLAHWTCIKSK
jgi:hypothetical protein